MGHQIDAVKIMKILCGLCVLGGDFSASHGFLA